MEHLKALVRDRERNPSEVPLGSAMECEAGYVVGFDDCAVCGASMDEPCRGDRPGKRG